jgi:Uncharacterized conserved protein
MPFLKLRDYATPGICQPHSFDEAEKKQIQHQIANFIKQISKEKLDKGPEAMRVTMADDMVIIKSEHYLTRMEQFIIQNPHGVDTVKSARSDAIAGLVRDGDVLDFLEKVTQAKPIYTLYESYPEDDYCIWVFMFDRRLV